MAQLLFLNLNPLKRRTGDCVFRALAFFFGISWREALDDLVGWAADRGLTSFNYRSTYNGYLLEKGYARHRAPRKGLTVSEFCAEYAERGKKYILSCPVPGTSPSLSGQNTLTNVSSSIRWTAATRS